jgi:8-hydroxy-5-deazaflavin:NADPH oxidoreductase
MKIGILGTGFMGRVLARKLAAAGHHVKVANSRGPDTIAADVLETGARAATAEDALTDVDVVILAMPHPGFERIRHLVSALPEQTVVIDISNYFPGRDPVNPELDAGKAESEWFATTSDARSPRHGTQSVWCPLRPKGSPRGSRVV